ncbi:hypothetical protein H113_03415 [Trichophyton rubrum MR1459]|nr:hypothetical protein H113_03415 [Trichophyton rubrum MR1459]EZG07355.1 hypothetical protein H106_03245 [Trichophyton rubrum CBS 735.88]
MLAPGWLGRRASTGKLNPLCVFYALDGGPWLIWALTGLAYRETNVSVGIVVIYPPYPAVFRHFIALASTAQPIHHKPTSSYQPVKKASKVESGRGKKSPLTPFILCPLFMPYCCTTWIWFLFFQLSISSCLLLYCFMSSSRTCLSPSAFVFSEGITSFTVRSTRTPLIMRKHFRSRGRGWRDSITSLDGVSVSVCLGWAVNELWQSRYSDWCG